jgi:hypothetical protein
MLTACLAKNNCRLWAELASQNNPRHGYQPDKQSKIKVALTKAKLKEHSLLWPVDLLKQNRFVNAELAGNLS